MCSGVPDTSLPFPIFAYEYLNHQAVISQPAQMKDGAEENSVLLIVCSNCYQAVVVVGIMKVLRNFHINSPILF